LADPNVDDVDTLPPDDPRITLPDDPTGGWPDDGNGTGNGHGNGDGTGSGDPRTPPPGDPPPPGHPRRGEGRTLHGLRVYPPVVEGHTLEAGTEIATFSDHSGTEHSASEYEVEVTLPDDRTIPTYTESLGEGQFRILVDDDAPELDEPGYPQADITVTE